MFGRIAAGLVHDLSHPIQNIGNSCKLIQKMFDDVEYRETFKRTVEREMVDRQARARRPAQHRPADSARAVPGRSRPHRWAKAVESMQQHAETAGLTLRGEFAATGALHRRGPLRARARLPQPDPQRDPGDRAGRAGRGRDASWPATACRSASTTPAAASRPSGWAGSSRISSPPSAAASGSGWRSRRRSSNSSAARSRSPARSARARRSSSSFRGRKAATWPRSGGLRRLRRRRRALILVGSR